MITSITVENFKCFIVESNFICSKINLLTGLNGRGKSSLLQSILLLSQSYRKNKTPKNLHLNGEWIDLGIYEDIKNRDSEVESIKIKISTNDTIHNSLSFTYNANPTNERIATLTGLIIDDVDKFMEMGGKDDNNSSITTKNTNKKVLSPIETVNTFNQFNKFHFISADRLGPVDFVRKTDNGELLNVGVKGEYFINVLSYHKELEVELPICKDLNNRSLENQVKSWLSYILEGASLDFITNTHSSIIEVLINSCDNKKGFKPVNVGFGYSYILPIIVACLISKPGDIMIIENPEAHLHPRAQSRFTELFTLLATYGVQLFIESHSEHILNGLRVNALRENNTLETEDISIYFWDNDNKYERLIVEKNGKIKNWPSKFFDQQESDLAEIFTLGRQKK